MEQDKLSFEDCLAEAQRLGYAEADPTFDIGGHDAAHKLALLTAIAFGTEVDADAIYVEGISSIRTADIEAADELGYRIKLLGVAVAERVRHRAAGAPGDGAEVLDHRADRRRHQCGGARGGFRRPAAALRPRRRRRRRPPRR